MLSNVYKRNTLLVVLIVIFLLSSCTMKDSGLYEVVDFETSNRIEIFDGRIGDGFMVDRDDYIERIISVSSNMSYYKAITEDQATGTSFNIRFYDDSDNIISKISMAWPEDIVYVNDVGYEIVEEDKYLLYALAADYMYLATWKNSNE